MKIYIIKSRIHFSFGETSEWLNLHAESTKEEAERCVERHIKSDQESGLASHEEYAIEELILI